MKHKVNTVVTESDLQKAKMTNQILAKNSFTQDSKIKLPAFGQIKRIEYYMGSHNMVSGRSHNSKSTTKSYNKNNHKKNPSASKDPQPNTNCSLNKITLDDNQEIQSQRKDKSTSQYTTGTAHQGQPYSDMVEQMNQHYNQDFENIEDTDLTKFNKKGESNSESKNTQLHLSRQYMNELRKTSLTNSQKKLHVSNERLIRHANKNSSENVNKFTSGQKNPEVVMLVRPSSNNGIPKASLPFSYKSANKFMGNKFPYTNKVSTEGLALPSIIKQSSIGDIDIIKKETKLNLLTQTQQIKVNANWSPYVRNTSAKFCTAAINNRDQNNMNKFRNDKIIPLPQRNLANFQIEEKSPYDEDTVDGQNSIQSFNDQSKDQIIPNYQSIDAKDISNKQKDHLIYLTFGDSKNQSQDRNLFNISQEEKEQPQSTKNQNKQEMIFQQDNDDYEDANKDRSAIKLNNQKFVNNNNSNNSPGVKRKELVMQKYQKKIKQQLNREIEIRKYFQANIHSQLQQQFTNTEFSTPGASSKFLEEYRIEDKSLLGSGGYAEVRLAVHKKTGHQVAIKIYEKYKLIDVQVKQNLIREIKLLFRLKQQNIMKLYESIDTLSNVYLITEYVEGLSLHDYQKLQESQIILEVEANNILKQLLRALHYLESKNTCHRDIKLENVLIDPETKEIKIIDFGFAVYSTKPLKVYCGTPNYMAPEIVSKKEYIGSPIDIWSCGIMYYVMLTGRFPFSAHTDRELIRKIQKGIYHVPKELSKDSVRILRMMLSVDPLQRGTAEEILSDPFILQLRDSNSNSLNNSALKSQYERNKEKYEDYLRNSRSSLKKGGEISPRLTLANISMIDDESILDIQMQACPQKDLTKDSNLIDVNNLDSKTVQHLVKLGYPEQDIISKVSNENEIVGQLYRRLLNLKVN